MINLNQKTYSQPIAFILMLVLVFSMFVPLPFSYAATGDVTDLLTGTDGTGDPTAEVRQDGNLITGSSIIDSTKPIAVTISFGVPVAGDQTGEINWDQAVSKGAIATFNLGELAINSYTGILKDQDGITVGSITMAPNASGEAIATVTFDGEDVIFDGSRKEVNCSFDAQLSYGGSLTPGDTGEEIITILERQFIVKAPAPVITTGITKSGTVDKANKKVTWTVTVSAVQAGTSTAVDLKGYKFEDNLASVGTYGGIFTVDGTATTAGVTYDAITKMLSYEFPEGSMSPQVITFDTEIPDEKYYSSGEKSITNTAQVTNRNNETITTSAGVRFTPEWISKVGVVSNEGINTGTYDPTSRTLTWKITANQMGASLGGVVITDTISGSGLEVLEAYWQKWDASAGEWTTPPLSLTTSGGTEYSLGSIDTPILLTLVTKVTDTTSTTGITTYYNSASIRWDGHTGGIGTGWVGAGVGYHGITKSSISVDREKGTIKWRVAVDEKGQSIPNKRVFDLLVYGTGMGPLSDSNVSGLPSGISLSALKAEFNQKYVEGSFATSDSNVTLTSVRAIYATVGGVSTRVADLLEVAVDGATPGAFTFETLVVNPVYLIRNTSATVYNTATLFSGSEKLTDARAQRSYNSNMLGKQMLTRDAHDDPENKANGSYRTTTTSAGFNYQDKTVIFRLNINGEGMNLSSATNAALENLGKITVSDKLPEGWEFIAFDGGEKYILFEGKKTPIYETSGPALTTNPSGFNADFTTTPGSVAFTFNPLDRPYVILVKAKVTDEKAAEYFSTNQIWSPVNTVNMTAENWNSSLSAIQTVKVESKIADKNAHFVTNGSVNWKVDYRPYDLTPGGIVSGQALQMKDTLPVGLELWTSANGALLLDDGGSPAKEYITAWEMRLETNGTYTEVTPVALTVGAVGSGNVRYDLQSRTLTFDIPDATKAYRFTYITNVTAPPGTGKLSNQVLLVGSTGGGVSVNDSYTVSSSDASATSRLVGSIFIKKAKNNGDFLPGATFALYAEDGTLVREGQSTGTALIRMGGLAAGTYFLEETHAPATYDRITTRYTIEITKSGINFVANLIDPMPVQQITAGNPLVISNTLSTTTGALTISKTVTGGGDKTTTFAFTVNLTDASGTSLAGIYPYSGTGGSGTISDGGIIYLADGQSVTINGLPAGTRYTVTEQDAKGHTVSVTNPNGTIVVATVTTAAFTNWKSTPGNPGGGGENPTKPGITTNPGITTPEAVYGSVTIVKADSADASRTLAGAVFQLFSENGVLLKTATTGSNGVIVFDNLEAGVKYYIKEVTAPDGYQPSRQTYSFVLSKTSLNKDITVTFKNTREGGTGTTEIDPEEIPEGWVIIEDEVPAGPGDLDVTPKTGEDSTALILIFLLAALTGTGFLFNGIRARRKGTI